MRILKQFMPKRILKEVIKQIHRISGLPKLIHEGSYNYFCRKSSTRDVTIRFITTRNISESPGIWFGNRRDNSTEFHYGEISSPVLNYSDNRLFNVHIDAEHARVKMLSRSDYMTGIDSLSGDTLVYIHGYKTSFMSAVQSVTQWASSSNFSGQIYLFSWPSQAKLTEYTTDKISAAASSTALATLLTNLYAKKTGQIHLFAHSMGSLALVNALRQLEAGLDALFENIILVAPDLDAKYFVHTLWPEIRKKAKKWSVYFSSKDLALLASRIINAEPRLGANSYPIEGLEFIDVSRGQLKQSGWMCSHNYHQRVRKITSDILALINGAKPSQRALIPHENNSADVWQFADSVSAPG